MTSIAIALPEALESFVATRVAAGGYANAQDYIVALVEQARRAEERVAMEAKLLEGVAALDRGEGRPMTAADWDRLRTQIRTGQHSGDQP